MVKNKIKTRVLTFVSTLIILLSLLSTIAFAQAPNVQIIPSSTYDRVFCTVYDEQTIDIVMLVYANIEKETYSTTIYCVLTEYYYNNYRNVSVDNILASRFEIIISTYHSANSGGPSDYYLDTLVNSLNHYHTLYLTSNGEQINPFNNYNLKNSINDARVNQFNYWEAQIQTEFDNGYAEGQYVGFNSGYNEGLTVGYNEGLTVGYTNALNDSDTFIKSIFKIFEAPFVFVQNITGFELFGIRVFDIFSFFIIISIGIFLFNKLRRFLPL